MLADIILKVAEMEGQNENGAYYPRPSSSGPQRCIRSMVYHGLGIERKSLPGRAVMIFSDSSFHEDLTDDWIRKTAYYLHSEQMEVNCGTLHGITLKGKIDGIVTDLTYTDFLFEHKAINHFTFQKLWNGEIPYDYVTQCCLYLKGVQVVNPDIDTAILLIKNKNTAQYMELVIYWNSETDTATITERTNSQGETITMGDTIENITENAFIRFAFVQEYINQRKLPLRQYDKFDDSEGWHCDYCQWGGVCWKDYEREFNELKIEGMLPNEIADMIRYYKELGAQKGDIEKEYKDLSAKIKSLMELSGFSAGRAGEYVCKLKLQDRSTIDKDMLTPVEIKKATKISTSKRLYVSNYKEGKSNE